jgi:hypothetical protein
VAYKKGPVILTEPFVLVPATNRSLILADLKRWEAQTEARLDAGTMDMYIPLHDPRINRSATAIKQ